MTDIYEIETSQVRAAATQISLAADRARAAGEAVRRVTLGLEFYDLSLIHI